MVINVKGKRLVRKKRPKAVSPLTKPSKTLKKRLEDEDGGPSEIGEERRRLKKKKPRPPGSSQSERQERSTVRDADGKIRRKKKTKMGAGMADLEDVMGGLSSHLDDISEGNSRRRRPLRRNKSALADLHAMRERSSPREAPRKLKSTATGRPKLRRQLSDPSFRESKTGRLLHGVSSTSGKPKSSKSLKSKTKQGHHSASNLDYPAMMPKRKKDSSGSLSQRSRRADLDSLFPSAPSRKKSSSKKELEGMVLKSKKLREGTSGEKSSSNHEKREASRGGRPVRRVKSSAAAQIFKGFSELEQMQIGIHKSQKNRDEGDEDYFSPRVKRHQDEKIKKMAEQVEEEQLKNEDLRLAMAKLEKELAGAKSNQEELERKMRKERRENERTLTEKNKEIAELSETVDRILEAERGVDKTLGGGPSGVRLEEELKQLQVQEKILLKTVTEREEALEKAEKELKEFKENGKQSTAELQAAQETWKREKDELEKTVKDRDETIAHLFEQLKDLKTGNTGNVTKLKKPKTQAPVKNDSAGGWWSLQSSPGTLAKQKSMTRAERIAQRNAAT